MAVAGDSGGGNLAAVVCQQLRDLGGPQPSAQLLLYPNVARGADQPSAQAFGRLPFLTLVRHGLVHARTTCRGAPTWAIPRISPAEGDLAGLPPALVVTAGVDPLHDSGRDHAEALAAAGNSAEWLDLPDSRTASRTWSRCHRRPRRRAGPGVGARRRAAARGLSRRGSSVRSGKRARKKAKAPNAAMPTATNVSRNAPNGAFSSVRMAASSPPPFCPGRR